MSTRKRSAIMNQSIPPKSFLPPPRKGHAIAKHKTTRPLSEVRFSTFVYILSGLALAFISFNAWRMWQLKNAAGGWWNLARGRRLDDSAGTQPYSYGVGGNERGETIRDGVEDRINALAEALGIPPRELASAIAGAVKSHSPPASLTSLSAEATQSGPAVNVLMGDHRDGETQPGVGVFAGFDDLGME